MINGAESSKSQPLWWVIHSRPRCEKKMAEWLNDRECPSSLPLRRQRRDYASKSVVFHLPLFPGYCFGKFAEIRQAEVYASGYAARLLAVVDQRGFFNQLSALEKALESGGESVPVPYLEPGRRVRISAGKFRGLEGKIERLASGRRLILSLDILQQSVAVVIDQDRVQLTA